MAGRIDERKVLRCSFCNKTQDQVRKLIAGPNVYICDECVEVCTEIIEDEFDGIEEGKNFIFKWFDIDNSDTLIKPRQIFEKLKNNDNNIKHIVLKEIQ